MGIWRLLGRRSGASRPSGSTSRDRGAFVRRAATVRDHGVPDAAHEPPEQHGADPPASRPRRGRRLRPARPAVVRRRRAVRPPRSRGPAGRRRRPGVDPPGTPCWRPVTPPGSGASSRRRRRRGPARAAAAGRRAVRAPGRVRLRSRVDPVGRAADADAPDGRLRPRGTLGLAYLLADLPAREAVVELTHRRLLTDLRPARPEHAADRPVRRRRRPGRRRPTPTSPRAGGRCASSARPARSS